jgi:DNA-binding cell septation regulator SpoVG
MSTLAQPNQTINTQSVEVIDLRLASAGSVRAYARIRVGPLAISGVKVIQQQGQRAWVKLPDQQSKDGKWFPVVTCSSPTLEEAISSAVLQAYREVAA